MGGCLRFAGTEDAEADTALAEDTPAFVDTGLTFGGADADDAGGPLTIEDNPAAFFEVDFALLVVEDPPTMFFGVIVEESDFDFGAGTVGPGAIESVPADCAAVIAKAAVTSLSANGPNF